MEVSVGSSRDTGIASHVGYQQDIGGKDATLVLANPAGGPSVLDLQSAATLTGLAVQGPALDINGISLPSFGAILRAVASNNDVNVLSTPHILTTDNEEAEIVVGDNVPFVSGLSAAWAPEWSGRRRWRSRSSTHRECTASNVALTLDHAADQCRKLCDP